MPNETVLQVVPGQLPVGFCPESWQETLNEFSAKQTVTFSQTSGSVGGIAIGPTKPSGGSVPWLRTDAFGRPTYLYYFAQGVWMALHPSVPGLCSWWPNAVPDFTTFDGGDGSAVTATTGPMWQLALDLNGTAIAAKMLITPGSFPSGAILNVGATGGEESHILTSAELPNSQLGLAANSGSDAVWNAGNGTGTAVNGVALAGGGVGTTKKVLTEALGSGAAHNNLPNYVVCYLLQRTSRLYYTVA